MDGRIHAWGLERVQPGVRRLPRRDHGRAGDTMCRSHGPVDAAVRFEALELRVALERWKAEHPRLAVFVLHRLEEADFALDDRPTERKTRRPRFDASELPGTP